MTSAGSYNYLLIEEDYMPLNCDGGICEELWHVLCLVFAIMYKFWTSMLLKGGIIIWEMLISVLDVFV